MIHPLFSPHPRHGQAFGSVLGFCDRCQDDDGCPNLNRGDPARTTTNRQLSLARWPCFNSLVTRNENAEPPKSIETKRILAVSNSLTEVNNFAMPKGLDSIWFKEHLEPTISALDLQPTPAPPVGCKSKAEIVGTAKGQQ